MSEFLKIYDRITSMLEEGLDKAFTYHDVEHTKRIVIRTEEVALKEGVSGRDLELLKIAALFHDAGFLESRENHEERSCKIARRELDGDLSADELKAVCGMIMATKIPQEPKNLPERILADADLYYLGTSRYDEIAGLLYLELQHFIPDLSQKDWLDIQINFLKQHTYHTHFAKMELDPGKQANLERLLRQI